MVPHYQTCKDCKCPHWDWWMLDCNRLPDECPYAVIHLVQDTENQSLDGKCHGQWITLSDWSLIPESMIAQRILDDLYPDYDSASDVEECEMVWLHGVPERDVRVNVRDDLRRTCESANTGYDGSPHSKPR